MPHSRPKNSPWTYIGFCDRPRADIFAPNICTPAWMSAEKLESSDVTWLNVFRKERGDSKTLATFSSAPQTKRWFPFPLITVTQFMSWPWTWGRAISCQDSSLSKLVLLSQGANTRVVCQKLEDWAQKSDNICSRRESKTPSNKFMGTWPIWTQFKTKHVKYFQKLDLWHILKFKMQISNLPKQ